jgi:hypothetical protein
MNLSTRNWKNLFFVGDPKTRLLNLVDYVTHETITISLSSFQNQPYYKSIYKYIQNKRSKNASVDLLLKFQEEEWMKRYEENG